MTEPAPHARRLPTLTACAPPLGSTDAPVVTWSPLPYETLPALLQSPSTSTCIVTAAGHGEQSPQHGGDGPVGDKGGCHGARVPRARALSHSKGHTVIWQVKTGSSTHKVNEKRADLRPGKNLKFKVSTTWDWLWPVRLVVAGGSEATVKLTGRKRVAAPAACARSGPSAG